MTCARFQFVKSPEVNLCGCAYKPSINKQTIHKNNVTLPAILVPFTSWYNYWCASATWLYRCAWNTVWRHIIIIYYIIIYYYYITLLLLLLLFDCSARHIVRPQIAILIAYYCTNNVLHKTALLQQQSRWS